MFEMDTEEDSEERGGISTVYDSAQRCVSYPWRSNFHGS